MGKTPGQNNTETSKGKKPKKPRVSCFSCGTPQESDILPGNVVKNKNIEHLHTRWTCHLPSCHSDLCYVPPDNGVHFPLSHSHFDKWAAAMVFNHFFLIVKLLIFDVALWFQWWTFHNIGTPSKYQWIQFCVYEISCFQIATSSSSHQLYVKRKRCSASKQTNSGSHLKSRSTW